MPKKRKAETGVVFETRQKKLSKEDIEKFSESVSETPANKVQSFSYDPFKLTGQIIDFGLALTGIPLYTYQYSFAYRVIYAVITFENEALTALWSRQSGKSETVAFIIDTLMVILPSLGKLSDENGNPIFPELKQFERGFKIGLYAPQQLQVDTTYERALDRLMSENAEMIMEDPEIDVGLTSAKLLTLSNGSATIGQVASRSSKIESKTHHLIFIEESQDSDDFVVQKSIEPMTSATGGTIVKVGTTGTVKNHFWAEIQENKKRNRFIKDPRLFFHFEFDYKKVIAYKREQFEKDGNVFHLHYEKDVLKKRHKWGEDSEAFKLGYGLIWPLESGMFITDGDFDAMCNKKLGVPKEIQADWTVVAGIDLGKDYDSTVITVARVFYPDDEYTTEPPTKQVLDWIEIKTESYEVVHYTILDYLAEWGVQIVYIDYTGVGRPVTDRLMAACGDAILIVPYQFSRPSKSDMWFSLYADIKAGRMIVPANKVTRARPEFVNFEIQMKGLQKWYDGGYMVCEHGSGMGEHDDYCDSLGLVSLAGNHELPEEVSDEENIFFPQLNNNSTGLNHRFCGW